MPDKYEVKVSEFMQRVLDSLPLKYDRLVKVEKYPKKMVYFLTLEKSEELIHIVLKFTVPALRIKWTGCLKKMYEDVGVQILAGVPSKKPIRFTISYYKGYPISEDLKVVRQEEQAETLGARFAYPQVKAWLMGVNLGDNPENFVVSKKGIVPIDEGDLRSLSLPIEQLLLRSIIIFEGGNCLKEIRDILLEDAFFKGMVRFEKFFQNELLARAFFLGFFRNAARLLQKK